MNAIILAAGVGHRMNNLTRQLNKALLPVGGIPIIERCITYLRAAGIVDITIITGHKHELFLPLEKIYGVKLLHNKKYSTHNGLYSLKLALDQLEDTYLIHGDVLLFKNLFLHQPEQTTLYTVFKNTKGIPSMEVLTDQFRSLKGFQLCKQDRKITTHLGVTYIAKQEADLIKTYFAQEVSDKQLRDYKGELDAALFPLLNGRAIAISHVDSRYAMDINLIADYYQACIKYETYWKKPAKNKEKFVK